MNLYKYIYIYMKWISGEMTQQLGALSSSYSFRGLRLNFQHPPTEQLTNHL